MSAFRIVVLASGSGTNLQAILDTLHGRDGDRGGRGRLRQAGGAGAGAGARRPGSRPRSSPPPSTRTATARDAAMGDWIEARGGRPRRPRRLHAAAQRGLRRPLPQPRSSTSTPPCCPPSPGSTRSARRWRPGSRRPGSPSTSSTRGSTPARRSSSARCAVPPERDAGELEAAVHARRARALPGGDPHDRARAGLGSTRATRGSSSIDE